MNAIYLYTIFAAYVVACYARPQQQQQQGSFNLASESDIVDYQDYQIPARARPQPLGRPARPRSPIISGTGTQTKVTPVPILKQINRHNEDGSYTYGFEGADGSFKIETKLASGEVIGKYGYVDDSGKTRVVEYGANKYGFQPAGEGITIPPVTITNDTETQGGDTLDGDYTTNDLSQPTSPSTTKFSSSSSSSSLKTQNAKRKWQKPFQQVFIQQQPQQQQQQQRYKPHSRAPTAYMVRELDENAFVSRAETNQRQLITPADVNSLQYLLGGAAAEYGDVLATASPYASPNDVAQRKSNAAAVRGADDDDDEPPPRDGSASRPPLHTFPIPAIFEMGTAAAAAAADAPSAVVSTSGGGGSGGGGAGDFTPSKFVAQFELSPPQDVVVTRTASRNSGRSKSRPQFLLITPVDGDAQPAASQNAVRRHSSRPESRSILDELLKQYAIPNMAAPINDFSFGYN